MKIGARAAEEFNDRQTDRVWPSRGSRGEDTMRTIIRRRRAEEFKCPGAVELPKDHEMRKAFDVGEAGLELGQDLKHAFGLVLRSQAFGDLFRFFVRAADVSDRAGLKHEFS